MSFVSLRTYLLTKLTAISSLQNVDDHHKTITSGFPACTFEPSQNENDYLTNAENIRKYGFQIIVHQEVSSGGTDNAVGVLAAAVDAIITALDADFTLGATCDFAYATPSKWGRYLSGNATILYAEINLVCVSSAAIA